MKVKLTPKQLLNITIILAHLKDLDAFASELLIGSERVYVENKARAIRSLLRKVV